MFAVSGCGNVEGRDELPLDCDPDRGALRVAHGARRTDLELHEADLAHEPDDQQRKYAERHPLGGDDAPHHQFFTSSP